MAVSATRSERRFASLLILPAAVFCLAFVAWPVLQLVVDSFAQVDVYGAGRRFVGFANYREAFGSEAFASAAGRTALYTVIVVGCEFLLGLAVALLFTALGQRSQVFRTVFMYPLMIAPVVAGILWRFLLIDNFGIVNELLGRVGLPSDMGWLSDANIVLWAVAVSDIWLTTPFMTLVLFAGLQALPGDVVEAARVDGADYWRLLTHIIVPQLRPVVAVAVIIRGVDAARAFDIILAQTDGGPQNASEMLSLLIYRTMVRYANPGLASAMSVVFLAAMSLIAIVAVYLIWRLEKATNERA